jgi:hypothetical protein
MKGLDLGFVFQQTSVPPVYDKMVTDRVCNAAKHAKEEIKLFLARPDAPKLVPGVLDYQRLDREDGVGCVWPELLSEGFETSQMFNFKPHPQRSQFSMKMTYGQFASYTEHLLSFHSFLKYGGHLLSGSAEGSQTREEDFTKAAVTAYRCSLQWLLSCTKNGIARGAGTRDFQTQKFLECSHFLKDHLLFGPPVCHNTSTGERGLKTWAKAPANNAQKRSDEIFKCQVAQNLTESFLLRLATGANHDTPSFAFTGNSEDYTNHGKTHCFVISPGVVPAVYAMPKNQKTGVGMIIPYPQCVVHWLTMHYRPLVEAKWVQVPDFELRIQIVAEVKHRGAGTIFRAHPNYRGEGPWYDFVSINFGEDLGQHVARCACFFEVPTGIAVPGGIQVEKGDTACLVQCADYATAQERRLDSMLYTHRHLLSEEMPAENGTTRDKVWAKLDCYPCEVFAGRVFCISKNPTSNKCPFWEEKISSPRRSHNFCFLLVKSMGQWGEAFLEFGQELVRDKTVPNFQ